MKCYTDDELVELVRDISADSEVSYWVADKIAERFESKNSMVASQRDRLEVAAKCMGYNLINELIEEGY